MDRRRYLARLGPGVVGGVGLAGCLGLGTAGGEFDVGMTSQAFKPFELTVEAGDRVLWLNNSTRAHTVTAYESGIPDAAAYFATGGFESEQAARNAWDGIKGAITSGQRFAHTFDTPGTYRYFCIPHEPAGMVGTVTVEG